MFYLGLEMSTLPVAALVNFDLHKRRSAEGAFKLIVTSAFASGLLLFGISWLYGSTGTISFAVLATGLSVSPFTVMALMLVLAGVGFKISAVPFHLWTADVYEGAPMPVTAYLSVVSKAAVVFVLAALLYKVLGNMQSYWYTALVLLAIFTMLAGNLFALRQQQIKRFLAFSSIAQVGFILVALSNATAASEAASIYFIIIYLFSNLAAFGVVAAISQQTGKEMISDYTGLRQSNPALAWMLAIALFSLAGVPPMAGFFGKFFLLMAGAGKANWMLIIVAALNMIISMAYYLNIVRLMFMQQSAEPLPTLKLSAQTLVSLGVCIAGIMVTGLFSGAYQYIAKVIHQP
jgi:NADH-quinone oxidoreductase subunit N